MELLLPGNRILCDVLKANVFFCNFFLSFNSPIVLALCHVLLKKEFSSGKTYLHVAASYELVVLFESLYLNETCF